MKLVFLFLFVAVTFGKADRCQDLTLASKDYAYVSHSVGSYKLVTSMTLLKRYSGSPCTLGTSFGFRDADVWVDKGCRAQFKVCEVDHDKNCYDVSLSSNKNKYFSKDLGTNRIKVISMNLVKKYSASKCTYGLSYGYHDAVVWVNRGCRAVFRVCDKAKSNVIG